MAKYNAMINLYQPIRIYQKIDVPNIESIVEEILKLVKPQIDQNLRFWDVEFNKFKSNTPTFIDYMRRNFYRMPILYRFYNTPPFGKLGPHIDNGPAARNRIGFNIPLLGTDNTEMNYYDTPADNLELSPTIGFGHLPAQIIKDYSKLVLLDSVVIDKPTLLRTDAIHEVINNKDSYRLVMGMKLMGNTFEEVYKFGSI